MHSSEVFVALKRLFNFANDHNSTLAISIVKKIQVIRRSSACNSEFIFAGAFFYSFVKKTIDDHHAGSIDWTDEQIAFRARHVSYACVSSI